MVVDEVLSNFTLVSDVSYLQSTPDGIRSLKFCHFTPDLATWKTPTLTIDMLHEGTIASDYPSTESHNLERATCRNIL